MWGWRAFLVQVRKVESPTWRGGGFNGRASGRALSPDGARVLALAGLLQ